MLHSGCETSSRPDTSPPVKLTSEASSTFDLTTLPDLISAISLLASVAGPWLRGSQAGPIIVRSGQDRAPASPSALLESSAASTTSATFGPSSAALSRSDALQSFLESRLRERLTGSVSCEVIWSKWNTPWGQSRSKPRARTRTISGIDIGLWPTATSVNRERNSATMAKCAAFRKRNANQNTVPLYLGEVVKAVAIGLWPTATASDHKSRSASPATLERNARPLREIVFAMWSTIRASDGAKGGPNMSFGAGGSPLPSQVSKAASMSNAPMENGVGSLHPEFAGWEMGYPPEWLSCAPSETRSTRAQRRTS